jgi:hypothetical protein
MPILKGVEDSVSDYNEAALAYNNAHGYGTGSPKAAPMSTTSDIDLAADLAVLTLSFDASMSFLRARLDAPFGVGDGLITAGLGIYPVGLAFTPSKAPIVPFALAGAVAHYVKRDDLEGALLEARLVAGVVVRGFVSLEVGYRPYVIGAVVDRDLLDTMPDAYDPTGAAAPAMPSNSVRGGVGQGVDISVGFSL